MPEIKRFSGFKLLMFFHDENPPHLHIKGSGLYGEGPNFQRRSACWPRTE